MRKYENVDLTAALGAVVEKNTEQYKSDFQYDIEMFQRAAANPDGENKHLLWFSRQLGTQCVRERAAFIRESGAHIRWQYCAGSSDEIIAYAVEVTGADNGRPMGNLFELDYKLHTAQLDKAALNAVTVALRFEDGTEGRYAYDDYSVKTYSLMAKHGAITNYRLEPENEEKLQRLLKQARSERQKYTPAVFKLRDDDRKPSVREQLARGKDETAKKVQGKGKAKHKDVSL